MRRIWNVLTGAIAAVGLLGAGMVSADDRGGKGQTQQEQGAGQTGQAGGVTGAGGAAGASGAGQTTGGQMEQQGMTIESPAVWQEAHAFQLMGTLSQKDGNDWTIARRNLPPVQVELHDRTQVLQNGQPVNRDALQPGTPVRARFQVVGNEVVAVSIDAIGQGQKGMQQQQQQQQPSGAETQGTQGDKQR